MSSTPHTIICGLGSVGFRILIFLQQLSDLEINVITLKTNPDWEDNLLSSGGKIFIGDARKEELLIQAGIEKAACIVIVTDSDATNLSIAIDAARLNPAIRKVLRLQHEDLAEHVKEHIHNIDIWNPDYLATPLFVRASLGEKVVGELSLCRSLQIVEEIDLIELQAETLRGLKFICALNHAQAVRESSLIDFSLLRGFTKALVIKAIAEKKVSTTDIKFNSTGSLLKFWSIILEWPRNIILHVKYASRRIKQLTLAIILVFLTSVFMFKLFLNLAFIDAIYFVTTIMTTVGFGDINLRTAPNWLKIYGCFLMGYSVLIVAALISLINNALISSRLNKLLGPRPTTEKPPIIVSGVGPLGYRVVKSLLNLGQNVFAISDGSKENFTEQLRELIPVIQAREFDSQFFSQAYISRAKAIVICSSNEIRNLTEGLSAKKANPNARVIVRTLDAQLARKMDISLPIDKVLSDSEFSATNFVASIFHKNVLLGIEWEKHFIVLKSDPGEAGVATPIEIDGEKLFLSIQKLRK